MAKCPRCAEVFFDPCPHCNDQGLKNLHHTQEIEILRRGLSTAIMCQGGIKGLEGDVIALLPVDDIWRSYRQPGEAQAFLTFVREACAWAQRQKEAESSPQQTR